MHSFHKDKDQAGSHIWQSYAGSHIQSCIELCKWLNNRLYNRNFLLRKKNDPALPGRTAAPFNFPACLREAGSVEENCFLCCIASDACAFPAVVCLPCCLLTCCYLLLPVVTCSYLLFCLLCCWFTLQACLAFASYHHCSLLLLQACYLLSACWAAASLFSFFFVVMMIATPHAARHTTIATSTQISASIHIGILYPMMSAFMALELASE